MSKFTDRLWREIVREHGADLRELERPSAGRGRAGRMPRVLAGTGLVGVAGLGAVLAIVLGSAGATPAFAVTHNSDGSYSVAVSKLEAIPFANARLRALGLRARLVAMAADCTSTTISGAPQSVVVPQIRAAAMAAQARINPGQIPAGRTLVVPAFRQGAVIHLARAMSVVGAIPGCLPAPARVCFAAAGGGPFGGTSSTGTATSATTTGTGTSTGTTTTGTSTSSSATTTTGTSTGATAMQVPLPAPTCMPPPAAIVACTAAAVKGMTPAQALAMMRAQRALMRARMAVLRARVARLQKIAPQAETTGTSASTTDTSATGTSTTGTSTPGTSTTGTSTTGTSAGPVPGPRVPAGATITCQAFRATSATSAAGTAADRAATTHSSTKDATRHGARRGGTYSRAH
jgi:hypothetical protein